VHIAEFEASLANDQPPAELGGPLRVLWLDAKGQFDAAHELAQSLPDPDGARLHAYLHRKEGDLDNAGYWYRRAKSPMPSAPLVSEWRALAEHYLGQSG